MPKLPRVSGDEAISALKRMGFEIVRRRGSHVIMRRGDTGTVIPLHKELAIGTLRSILRQAGLSAEAFIDAHKQ